MAYKIIYTLLALIDADETSSWYNDKMPGLGKRFLLDLSETIDTITKNPLIFSFLYDNIRKGSLKKFPYVILYFVNQDSVRIIAIVSTKRSSKYIRKRINPWKK